MATRRWILFLLAAAILALAGCNSGSTFNVQNPPPPPPPNISIAFQPAPIGTILIDTTTNLTAVVSNDPSNSGVSWSVTCSVTGNCGQLSAQHTASGDATTYTPPASLAGNSLDVNIVAFATASQATNVVAPITVTAFGSNLKGTYVLEATGADSNFNPYQFAGVIVLDGNGGISSGEQTVNFSDPTTGLFVAKSDAINNVGSSYFLGPDGRGTITLNPNDADIGAETFSLVFLSNSQALIAALPTSTLTISGTGTMDLQTTTAAPTGGYAFAVSGTDVTSASPTAFAGILNIDSPNNISGKGSVADQNFEWGRFGDTFESRLTRCGDVESDHPRFSVDHHLSVHWLHRGQQPNKTDRERQHFRHGFRFDRRNRHRPGRSHRHF